MKMPETPPTIPAEYDYGAVLNDLVSIGKFWELFELNDNKYPYWDKCKYVAKGWGYDPVKLWAAIKSNRRNNRLYFDSQYKFYISTPSLVQNYLHNFDMNLGGSMQGDGIIPAQDKNRYLISSLMEEAIASSQLEGAATTRKLAKEMLEANRAPRNESEQMILNNYEAMKWIVSNKDRPFTNENILKLHAIITKNTLGSQSEEGAFRQTDDVNVVDVQTGDVVHHPPAALQLAGLMKAFCDLANERSKPGFFIHPITRGIVLHFLIGFIHPFTDGNGRTARTIFYWYLIRKGYWLIEYMSVSRIILKAKAQYARAYLHTEIDNNDLTYFIIYNLQCIHTALDELKKYIERKTNEKKNTIVLLRGTDFNERQIRLLQEVLHDPTSSYSVAQVEEWFRISNQTARNDLNGLVDAGLLNYRKAGRHMRFFAVNDFTDRLATLKKKF
ncbi:MAG: Fic family protein [Sphingobacteriales bacterium]|nr:MAG: Fic family protein [Sphingobacteriales bacterium]